MESNHLPTLYQQFIHLSRYSRWLPEESRRETWSESVSRYFDFFTEHLEENTGYILDKETRNELEQAVLSLEVMPSMRCMMTAGEALKRENIAGFNCSYVAVDHVRAFDEILYILMNGTGVGFSVENEHVEQLPDLPSSLEHVPEKVLHVQDSKLGWAITYRKLLAYLYEGLIPNWDVSAVRPAGAPLKTFGGRASGPEPLVALFDFTVEMFLRSVGSKDKLSSLDCHDLVCKIAEIVVVGGVRRSALISLSDLDDGEIRDAKTMEALQNNTQRYLSNNSAVYKEKPSLPVFLDEWGSLIASNSGERGIFSRASAQVQAGLTKRRDPDHEFGTNPCAEIILRSKEFCNLSEIIVRPTDTMKSLARKARLATILGTFQSTLTNFNYIRDDWKHNTEEERLLGVSMTGIMDSALTNGSHDREGLERRLNILKSVVVATNKDWAGRLGIPQSAATTCVKPSGTVSQLVDSASGIHARHNPHYIRTVRADKKDPLAQMMVDHGIPVEDDVYQPSNYVFSFPMKVSEQAICRKDMSAIEQLEIWAIYQKSWCEHKPSVTISVKDDEWLDVATWVYKNFDMMSGVSFLPFSDSVYPQMPYQDIDKTRYLEEVKKIPLAIDWSKLADYEKIDQTSGSQELACSAGVCELVDLVSS